MTIRYALYFAPPPTDPLWRFGSSVIGYDATTGEEPAFPEHPRLNGFWPAATAEPRRYGFHATLKAPFELKPGFREANLREAVDDFVRAEARFVGPEPVVARLKDFVALVPTCADERIAGLAARAVTAFEPFRAPLSPEARARRLASPLTSRQIWHLDRYGYPYVFDDFRFHMTLTGPLGEREGAKALELLRDLHKPVLAPLRFEDICVFRQSEAGGRFRIVHRARFEG